MIYMMILIFLPFHRTYLECLEDWLISQGFPQYVPLPKWSGLVLPPIEFRTAGPNANGVSPACSLSECSNAPDLDTGCGQANVLIWENHTVDMPGYLLLNPPSGTSLCDLIFTPSNYTTNNDNSGSSGLSSQIEDPWHNEGHSGFELSPVMMNFKSPAAAIFWLWHAAVDDKWKEWEQHCHNQTSNTTLPVDLYMKDNNFVVEYDRDRGEEPNIDDGPMWVSKDIWVRNQADGVLNQTHQNPEYGEANYIYVRVRNRGFETSLGTEQLNLYWAKASTALAWPNHWNGSITVGAGVSLGELVGVQNIPQIGGQNQTILQFAWNPPNPEEYEGLIDDIHHFCLLARIETDNDPMAFEETNDVYQNTKNNNNIVWKNLSVVDLESRRFPPKPTGEIAGATIFIGNTGDSAENFDIIFQVPRNHKGNSILAEAEVTVLLDDTTWDKWTDNGKQKQALKVVKEDKKQLIIENDQAILKNLHFTPNEQTLVKLSFNFLTKQMSGQKEFEFDVIQKKAGTNEIVGGERFHILVAGKEGFFADAGTDVEISQGDLVTINAYQVAEEAIYNWYDMDGHLIYTGTDFSISVEMTKKYKLEIIAELDGVKDYDEIEVKAKEYEIKNISPNPANTEVNVAYKARNANSAYLTITQSYGASYNYILDTNQENTSINVAGYQPGIYYMVLVCNGQVVDSKSLVVE